MDPYRVEIIQPARKEIRSLPGYARQPVLRELRALTREPQPHHSQEIMPEKSGISLPVGITLHRIRLSHWRIVYALEEEWKLITVLAVRKRPPYQYNDLEELIKNL
jgi:mRNA interferase RelE/StbE